MIEELLLQFNTMCIIHIITEIETGFLKTESKTRLNWFD